MKKIKLFIYFAVFFSALTARAQSWVHVVFYSFPPGTLATFEPNSRFEHSALFYQNTWIDSYPYYGVRFSKTPPFERPGLVLRSPQPMIIPVEALQFVRSQKFNILAPWTSTTETYCSKLLGQLLNLPPEPMDFSSPFWNSYRQRGIRLPQGEPGLSPDDVARLLLKRGFKPVSRPLN